MEEPGNEQTAKLWAWLSKVLVAKDFVEVAKARFRVSNVRCSGDVDLENRCFAIDMTVTYECYHETRHWRRSKVRRSSVVVVALKDEGSLHSNKTGRECPIDRVRRPVARSSARRKRRIGRADLGEEAVPVRSSGGWGT